MVRGRIFIFVVLSLFLITFISAPFGYDNPTIPSLRQELFDDRPSGFYMPNNLSVFGNFSFNGGWENNGLSIIDGDIYAQTGYFLNLTSLNITKQNLTINENFIVLGDIITQLTQGSVPFIGLNGNITEDNSGLFYDQPNGRLGVGTNTPDEEFELSGLSSTRMKISTTGTSFSAGIIFEPTTNTGVAVENSYIFSNWISDGMVFRLPRDIANHGYKFRNNADADLMFIDSGGNVGIGTVSPNAKLHIKDGGFRQGLLFESAGSVVERGFLYLGDGTNSTISEEFYFDLINTAIHFRQGVNGDEMILRIGTIGGGDGESGVLIKDQGVRNGLTFQRQGSSVNRFFIYIGDGTSGTITGEMYWDVSNSKLNIRTGASGDTNTMTLDDGNIGIGTTTPSERLSVAGNIAINDSDKFYFGDAKDVSINFNGTQTQFTNEVGSGSFVFPTGNVGIGTGSPSAMLEIHNPDGTGSSDQFKITDGAGRSYFIFSDQGTNSVAHQTSGGTKLFFDSTGSLGSKQLVLSGNDVGFGTDSPVFKVHISSTGEDHLIINQRTNTDGDEARLQFGISTVEDVASAGIAAIRKDGSSGEGHLAFYTNPTLSSGVWAEMVERMRIQNDGNVGIGTTTPSSLFETGISAQTNEVNLSNTLFVNSTSGRVGIGTGSPNNRLEINAVSGEGLRLNRNNAGHYLPIEWSLSDTIEWSMGTNSVSGNFGIFEDGIAASTRLVIKAGGNVGIGTTSPDFKLQVNGSIAPEETATSSIGSMALRWLKGWFSSLDVAGNITATGNITSENVFIPQYIFPHTDATIPLTTASVWKNISFDQEETAIKFGISHTFNDNTNQTFTITQAGVYNLEYDFDVIDTSVGASDIDVAGRIIYKNGTEILGSAFETDITKQQIETEVSHNTLARLNAGDQIIFQFIADDVDVVISTHGTFGSHPDSATIIIRKVANL